MIQDIYPSIYKCEFSDAGPKSDDYILYREGKNLLMKRVGEKLFFPTFSDTNIDITLVNADLKEPVNDLYDKWKIFRGVAVNENSFWATEDKNIFKDLQEFVLVDSRSLRHYEPSDVYYGIINTDQILRWRGKHKFCGKCGNKTVFSETERAICCPECGLTIYPQICPAVTISIINNGKLLLAKNKNSAGQRFAQIAGFVEIGETFEAAAKREAYEETGLKIKNVTYFANQPWALTDAHMIGFTAEVDGSDAITLQDEELSEYRWFSPNEIPEDLARTSLTYEMIASFRNKYIKPDDKDMSFSFRDSFYVKNGIEPEKHSMK